MGRQKHEELLTALLDASPTVLYVRHAHDPFVFTFVSNNASEVLGAAPGDFTRNVSFWTDAIHPDDAGRVRQCLAAIDPDDRAVHSIDYRVHYSGAGFRWVSDQYRLVIGANGEPAVFGAWIDVSVWKRIEEALDGDHHELRALFDQKRLHDRLEALAVIGRAIRHADSAQDAANAVLGRVAHLVPCGLATVAVYDSPCLTATCHALTASLYLTVFFYLL